MSRQLINCTKNTCKSPNAWRGVIVGQEEVIEQLLVALLCRGHCILEGVPGLAKTLMVSTLASLLNQTFRRIQFTPDLMPADITGTDILEEDRTTGKRVFRFVKGPLFGNMILADEINRTPPKTQSALLEAMQERQLTVGGQTYPLPNPFLVLATQNPIEQEGTYPLPEAQLDRFMLKIQVEYPTREQEIAITKRGSTAYHYETGQVLTVEEILAMQDLVRRLPVGDHVYAFAVDLVRRSRPNRPSNGDFIIADGDLGRRPQGLHLSGSGRQGPRHSARPLSCHHRRHCGHGPARLAPPPDSLIPRRSGRAKFRLHHPAIDRRGRRPAPGTAATGVQAGIAAPPRIQEGLSKLRTLTRLKARCHPPFAAAHESGWPNH